MRKLGSGACALAAGLALIAAGCGGSGSGSGSSQSGGGQNDGAIVAKAQKGLDALKTTVLSTGPNGEKPSPASALKLSASELQQIKDKKATAAIVLHYGGNDWSTAQVDGLRNQLQKMGIRVIAVTDA